MNGAAARSVVMKEVTAMQRPAGTAVNTTHMARRLQVGRVPATALGGTTAGSRVARPAPAATQMASNEKPTDQRSVCVLSVKNGSIAKGEASSAQNEPRLDAA